MSKWRKVARLTRAEQWLLCQTLLLLPLVAMVMRVVGFARCKRWLANSVSGRRARQLASPSRMAHLVNIVSNRVPWRATCLHRSMVLWWLLGRRGVSSELRIGVRKDGDRFEAHAWLEESNVPLNDRHDVRSQFRDLGESFLAGAA